MSDTILLGTRKGFFSVDRAAGGWRIGPPAFLGSAVSIVLHDRRDGSTYAALKLGHFGCKLHRSSDGGKTWEEIAVPVYPPKPEGYVDIVNPMSQKSIPWSLDMIWALEPGGKDQPGRLWAGTTPGGLFRSDDWGASWSLVQSLWDNEARREWFGGGYDLPGIHSICVDPRDSKRVTVAVSCGGVWQTVDDGQTWKCAAEGMFAEYMPPEQQRNPNIQDGHRIVQCPAAPDAFWCQHHNGIFRSIDGSTTWEAVPNARPSVFGFAVAVHPNDPATAWFVPAVKDEYRIPVDGKLVVSRTKDGGQTFDVLGKGLPQENAYDLIYRHGLDVDETGRRLAFGSTTGGLYVSDDAGDSWTAVTTHLPPINCLRFA